MYYPFGRNRYGNSNTAGHADQVLMKERLENTIKRAKNMRMLMQIAWAGP